MKRSAVLSIVITLFCSCPIIKVSAQQHLKNDPFAPYISSMPEKVDRINIEKGKDKIVEQITFSSRQGRNTIYGIITSPAAQGKYPALLVFHGGSSCAQEVQGIVQRYAGLGYVAMAID